MQPLDWAGLKAALHGLDLCDNAAALEAASRDYYWYSPILHAQLANKRGELLVKPRGQAEVMRIAAACAKFRVPLTVRGGGTGNYGQCVPLEGGVILDITRLNRIVSIRPGRMLCEAGALIADLDRAARDPQAALRGAVPGCEALAVTNGDAAGAVTGGTSSAATGAAASAATAPAPGFAPQEILIYPSTRDIATIGGFIAGGYAGAGSIRNGILKDPGNVSMIRVVTLEESPRVIELRDADIQKVHHAFGTNGIITQLEIALKPAVAWLHHITLFPDYAAALAFGVAVTQAGIDTFLLTPVERRFAPFYGVLGRRFPPDRDAMFAMVHPAQLDAWRALAQRSNGVETLCLDEAAVHAAGLPPAFECSYNHTTLMALKMDRGYTYLQVAYPQPFDIALVTRQMERYGDELFFHHEFARQFGDYALFALPLVVYFDQARINEIISEFEADGCLVFNPHVYTIEDGGMKTIDTAQIDFKKIADPHGLMNPGKTRGWTKDMARP